MDPLSEIERRRNKNRAWLKYWLGALAWCTLLMIVFTLAGAPFIAAPIAFLAVFAALCSMLTSFQWMSYERQANAPPMKLKRPRTTAKVRSEPSVDEILAEFRAAEQRIT